MFLRPVILRPVILRGLLIGAGLLMLVPGLPATSEAQSQVIGRPVAGMEHAYHGVPAPPPGPPIAFDEFFFEGVPTDQASKQAGSPSATFGKTQPIGPGAVQSAYSSAGDEPADPQSAFWKGSYTGSIDGEIEFRWYWSTNDIFATLLSPNVTVTVFADVGEGSGRIIGQQAVSLAIEPEPLFNLSRVRVKGDVASELLVQVKPVDEVLGSGFQVHYGSALFPSGFGIPPPGTMLTVKPQTKPVPYAGETLRVQSTYIGADAHEPTVGIRKDGTAFYTGGGWKVATPVASAVAYTEVYRSTDGGLGWESVHPELAPGVQGPPATVDPYVFVDEETDRVFNIELYGGCSYLNYSDDGGDTWSTNPAACGDFVNDHQTLVTGPPPNEELRAALSGYPRIVYYCFNRVVDSSCGRSLDGGTTFLATRDPAFFGLDPETDQVLCGGLHGHLVTDAAGRLFLPKGHCGYPWIGISEDGGDTWKRVMVSDRAPSGLHIQTSVAVDDAGNLFYVWWDGPGTLPYLSVSKDHGDTWSTPLMIAPPGVQQVIFPTIAAGAAGRIAITFPGTSIPEPAAEDQRPWHSYVVVSTNALDPNPLFLSTTANPPSDPIHRGSCGFSPNRCAGMFDFLDVVVSPAGEAWATAVDTCAEGCVTDPSVAATAERGMIHRQMCGPRLRGAAGSIGQEGCLKTASGAPRPLAATGPASVSHLTAALLLVMAAALSLWLKKGQRA